MKRVIAFRGAQGVGKTYLVSKLKEHFGDKVDTDTLTLLDDPSYALIEEIRKKYTLIEVLVVKDCFEYVMFGVNPYIIAYNKKEDDGLLKRLINEVEAFI